MESSWFGFTGLMQRCWCAGVMPCCSVWVFSPKSTELGAQCCTGAEAEHQRLVGHLALWRRQQLVGEPSHCDGFSSQPLLLLNRQCLSFFSLIAASVLAQGRSNALVCRLIALLLASREAEQHARVLLRRMRYSP